ncbi:transcriptional regulator, LuxR family protein [Roseobacter sp. SK209-2-6]|nr:transcriptional regulator, LuxR family protein [Roseobacter sp. SK209-2-6]
MQICVDQIAPLCKELSLVIEGQGTACDLIQSARHILPFTAGFAAVNRKGQQPVLLGDTYAAGPAKEAVQLYARSTYLLNPVYNAFLNGLPQGIYAMADLAPDNWRPAQDGPRVLPDQSEEIGYRTPGWPSGLQELSLVVDLPDGAMGEISFAHPAQKGGFSKDAASRLEPFLALYALAFRKLWSDHPLHNAPRQITPLRLADFAQDALTARESEVVQLILQGHSSLSISLTLGIALPTVKSHRKNAYTKLGISTQQQLFSAFLTWQAGANLP